MSSIVTYAFCNVSVMSVRRDPSHRSEQTSQLLFGEKTELIASADNDWVQIRCGWDGHEGWCKKPQLTELLKKEYKKETKYLAGNNTGKLILPGGEMWLPIGATLTGIKGGNMKVGQEPGIFKGKKLNLKKAALNAESIKTAALRYLHAPFQWGGRSPAGIDCSGFIQMAFKLCDFPLPRDASQQAEKGMPINNLKDARCGDLAFFEEPGGGITHVGMILDAQTIVHSTETAGRVVIEQIDGEGIMSAHTKSHTHKLKLIKRLF